MIYNTMYILSVKKVNILRFTVLNFTKFATLFTSVEA